MQGMINRWLEGFLRTSYGDAFWNEALVAARLANSDFLTLSTDRKGAARRILLTAARKLEKPLDEMLEDLGAWLVQRESLRRLLRFSGPDFAEFVQSLDELPGRARLVLLDMPLISLTVERTGAQEYRIGSEEMPLGWIWVLAGGLRGMADDYGALAVIAVSDKWIDLSIVVEEFALSRPFLLMPQPEVAP
ncbi:MAG: heme NO-binding domain-containing protein [Paracoccus sp. (in: a-proteobacteria)]|uniref:heme NO-binding domain-containing protein n=1 Tax=Paracoccus sp. TaxID=267 RepID=UPI0039E543DE